MRRKKLIMRGKLFLITAISYNIAFAQIINPGESSNSIDYLAKVLPASPEASKLGAYGNIPVGLFTGSPNIDIPIMNFSVGLINVPISLHYSSNGVKVDETNSSLGISWNLIAGGIVSRTIRGKQDDLNSGMDVFPNIDELGLWNPEVINYIKNGELGITDTEPDLYAANFSGNAAKYVIDKTGNPILFSQKNYIIGSSGKHITTADGTQYFFTEPETVTNRTVGGGKDIPSTNVTGWYLTKIQDINNNIVFIEYENNDYYHTLSESQTMKFLAPGSMQYYYSQNGLTVLNYPPYIGALIKHEQHVVGKVIKKIFSNNNTYGEIEFFYEGPIDGTESKHLKKILLKRGSDVVQENRFNYIVTPTNRRVLTEVKNETNGSSHFFQYNNVNGLPERLSYDRDIYGYYNAAGNPDVLVPKLTEGYLADNPYSGADQKVNIETAKYGLLQKIIYPTKGSSEIVYEPNGYLFKGNLETYTTGQLELASISGTNNTGNLNTKIFTAQKDERIEITIGVQFDDQCSSGLNTGHSKANLYAQDQNGQLPLLEFNSASNSYSPYQGGDIYEGVNQKFYVNVIQGQQIELGLQTKHRCTTAAATIYYSVKQTNYVEEWRSVGGNRVAQTITTSSDSAPIIKDYKYVNDAGEPSFIEVRKPYFIENNRNRYYQYNSEHFPTGNSSDVYYYTLTSSNINQLNALHPNLFYSSVIESTPNGTITHRYNTNLDSFGNSLLGQPILSAPWSNIGWDNGNELSTTYRNSVNEIVKELIYNYEIDSTKIKKIQGLSIRKNFTMEGGDVHTLLLCTAANNNRIYWTYYCEADHHHFWDLFSGKCKAPGHIDKWKSYTGPCYGKPVGHQIILDSNLENMDVVLYDNISYHNYLASQTTINYINGTPLQTITEYFYNSPLHYQVTSQKTTFSDSSVHETNYKYVHEKGIQRLIDANMVGIPLETETVKDGKKLFRTETKYEHTLNLFPSSVLSYNIKDLNDPLNNNPASTIEVTYDLYDDKGNLLQYTTKSGSSTTIVWGYNKTQPIAKIEGSTYAQVSSLATAIIDASNIDATAAPRTDETTFLTALDTFRKAYPNFQITTYSYDPLIGVRSITPPSGIREVYVYDSASRLQEVKDINGNILKEFKYNYKQ